MKVVKQKKKYNSFNIENLSLSRVLSIINALEYCQSKGLTNTSANQLIEALNNQKHKMKLGKNI